MDAVGILSNLLLLSSGRTIISESSSVNEFNLSSDSDVAIDFDLLCTLLFAVVVVLFVLLDDVAAANALGGIEAIDAVAIGSDAFSLNESSVVRIGTAVGI